MRNRSNPGGAPIGPKNGWAEWRARRDRQLAKPARNPAAQKLNGPKKTESPDAVQTEQR
jgi:hypothetical protein